MAIRVKVDLAVKQSQPASWSGARCNANTHDRYRAVAGAEYRYGVAARKVVIVVPILSERMHRNDLITCLTRASGAERGAESQPFAIQRRNGPAAHDAESRVWHADTL